MFKNFLRDNFPNVRKELINLRQATRQQKLFVNEFLKLRKKNQTQAAINAGYSPKSASSQAYQLLQNPIVLEYLEKRESQLEKEFKREFFFDAVEARSVMQKIMNDKDAKDSDKIAVAKDFLDRAGFKAVDYQEVTAVNINKSADGLTDAEVDEEIDRLKKELGLIPDG